MRDLVPIPFDNVHYQWLMASEYKYVTIEATGKEIEYGDEDYRREIVVTMYRKQPMKTPEGLSLSYCLEKEEEEIEWLALGEHNYIVYVERGGF